MVDFLTATLPDPFGVAINGGEVTKITQRGEIEWSTKTKLAVGGSHSSVVSIRNNPSPAAQCSHAHERTLEFSGNPAKFLNGHNLFGTDDLAALTEATVRKVGSALFPDVLIWSYDPSDGEISRIDITDSWLLPRESDVLPFLQAMQEYVYCPYRGRGVFASSDPSTLYYGYAANGKRAKDWQLKLYSKGREIAAHPLPVPAYETPNMLDEINRTIRVELTLRTGELKRLGLRKIGDWTPEIVAKIWRQFVDRLDFADAKMRLDMTDLAERKIPARYLDTIASWKAGNDLRQGRSRASFYKLRSKIREITGFDIASPVPKSNVIPLRRIIEAVPQGRPAWADQLTENLRRCG